MLIISSICRLISTQVQNWNSSDNLGTLPLYSTPQHYPYLRKVPKSGLETEINASPPDKMAHIVPNPQTIDYHTVLPDSYITILINGNIFQVSEVSLGAILLALVSDHWSLKFSDNYAANGDAGGKKAAKELVSSMAAVIQQVGHGRGVYPLIIRILGNPEWLSDVLFEASVIPDRANFGWFLQGFNGVKPLVEFTAVADGPSMPVYRTRGKSFALNA